MHELSIALGMIEAAEEKLLESGGSRITRCFVRIGALSGVVPEALVFAFEVASENTAAAGAELVIETVPLLIHCPACGHDVEPDEPFALICPGCGRPSGDVQSGRELELSALEIT